MKTGLLPLVLYAHALATVMMAGLIWFVQVVHYPLFAGVGEERFTAYSAQHSMRTTWVVMPLMLTELATAGLLVLMAPAGTMRWLAIAGLAAVLLIWASTFFVQVPLHNRLGGGFDAQAAKSLVAGNWPRTILWTARAVLALWFLRTLGGTP